MCRVGKLLWVLPVVLGIFPAQSHGQMVGGNAPAIDIPRGQAPAASDVRNFGDTIPASGGTSYLAPCCPTWQFFGEFLFLRPGNDDVPYAVPINGAIVPPVGAQPVQAGETAESNIGFQPAVRIGMARWLDTCDSIGVTYTGFYGSENSSIGTDAPLVLQSLVAHPGTFASPGYFLDAAAGYNIQFQLADFDYHHIFFRDEQCTVDYLLGARYAHLGQTFDSVFTGSTITETVDTHLRLDGAGFRLGLDGQRSIGCSGWSIYGSVAASFLGGTFHGDFTELRTPSAITPFVATSWNDDRVFSILDLEMGVGWTGCSGHVRVKAGYLFSAWINAPMTGDFIQAVHNDQPGTLNSTLNLDGLKASFEYAF